MTEVSTAMPESAGQADWIPIALSADIEGGSAAPAIVAGTEVAIWRDESGAVHAWQDRCPHRGMRLSFGFVRGDVLTCLYHGWRYGADGSCRFIPAHPDLTPPKTICVDAYVCVEQSGLVWMRRAGADGAPAVAFEAETIPARSLAIDAQPDSVFAILKREAGAALLGPNVVSLALPGTDGNSERLIAALQPALEGRSMLHLQVAGATGNEAHLQKLASRWAERFRRCCEAEAGIAPAAARSEEVPA